MAARNPHLYQRDIENIVDAILGEIAGALARGDRVELRGFGAFSTKQRQARTGRNTRAAGSAFGVAAGVGRFSTSAFVCAGSGEATGFGAASGFTASWAGFLASG